MINTKRLLAAISLASLVLPWSVSAATNDQMLDKAIKSMDNLTSYKLDFEMNMDIGERVIGKPGEGITGQIKVRASSRVINKEDGEGSLALDRMTISGKDSGTPIAFTLDQPVTINWIITNKKLYFRLAQAPTALIDFGKQNLHTDITPLIGVWIGSDMPNGVADLKTLPPVSSSIMSSGLPQNIREQAAIRKLPIFRVSRIEKRTKNNVGDDIARMRIRVNPSIVNAIQQAEIKALPRDKYFRTELTALNKRYTELRKNLTKISMVVNMNVTKSRVERMELGGNIQEPTESSTYDTRLKRNVLKTSSIRTFKFSVGINLAPAGSEPVIAPTVWKTTEEILNLLMPPTPTTTLDITDPMVQTLTAQ